MQTTYRDILNQTYQDRYSTNSSYSVRSFARDLGIPPSTLSEVLNGKKGISPKRSVDFAKKLKLPEWQVQLFCDLVTKEHAKSPRIREEAKLRLKERMQENNVHIINHNASRALTSWIDLAIMVKRGVMFATLAFLKMTRFSNLISFCGEKFLFSPIVWGPLMLQTYSELQKNYLKGGL